MKLAKLHRALLVATMTSVVLLSTASTVSADGTTTEKKVTKKTVCTNQYGGGQDCKEEVVEETVTHKPVAAGLEDLSFAALAAIFGTAGLSLLVLSKITKTIYLFD